MSDSLRRESYVVSTDFSVLDMTESVHQLIELLPPSRSALPVSDIYKKIRQFIGHLLLTVSISMHLLRFEIQIKVIPGHIIEIFLRRVPLVSSGINGNTLIRSPLSDDFELIYSGEWR